MYLGESLDGYDEINADKKLVMPGVLKHIAILLKRVNVMTSDDYETGSIQAFKNSSFVPFAAQKKVKVFRIPLTNTIGVQKRNPSLIIHIT